MLDWDTSNEDNPSLLLLPLQASQSSVEWAVALYDFAGSSDGDLSFQQGDTILITQHINTEWSCGRLNGREGMFPSAFVESCTGMKFSRQRYIVDSIYYQLCPINDLIRSALIVDRTKLLGICFHSVLLNLKANTQEHY